MITLSAVVHIQDNGDGSISARFYNTREELAKELAHRGKSIEEVESEDDPYENGTISKVNIEVDAHTGTFKPFTVGN
jgi:hypothetical protein